jgi:epsilon-lactone hydrolase
VPSAEHESMVAILRAGGAVLTPTEAPSPDDLRALRLVEVDAANATAGHPVASMQQHGGVECVAISSAPLAPTIIYCHGGGYVYTRAGDALGCLEALARRCHVDVVAPDYRRAPEHPFPAAVEDVVAVYEALLSDCDGTAGFIFAGDSAGGGLALAAMLAAQRAGLPQPIAGVLFSPWTDLTVSGGSATAIDDPVVNAAGLATMARLYLGTADPRDPLASPLYATTGELAGLPPLLVQVGTREALLDDARRFVRRASASGGTVHHVEHDDVVHMWIIMDPSLPESVRAFDIVAEFLADVAGRASGDG